jgi:hypothetical protein
LKRRLKPALEELEQHGFLEPLTAEERYSYVKRGCWRIIFIRGQAAQSDPSPPEPTSELVEALKQRGVTAKVAADASGWVSFRVHDPSPAQRLLYLLTVLPGLAVIAEIARRMANLLRTAQAGDPFTPSTARALGTVAKITSFAGVATWFVSQVAQGVLSGTMLTSPVRFQPHESPLGWLAVGLIFAALGKILDRGVAMRAELDTVI